MFTVLWGFPKAAVTRIAVYADTPGSIVPVHTCSPQNTTCWNAPASSVTSYTAGHIHVDNPRTNPPVQPKECSNWHKHILDIHYVTCFQELLKPSPTKLVRLKSSHGQKTSNSLLKFKLHLCKILKYLPSFKDLIKLFLPIPPTLILANSFAINSFIVTGEAHYHSSQDNRIQAILLRSTLQRTLDSRTFSYWHFYW